MGNRDEQDIPNLYLYSRKEDGSLEKVQLEQTEVEKDIGVYVDQKLSFQEQITNKTNKANIKVYNGNYQDDLWPPCSQNIHPIIQNPCPTPLGSI